MKEDSDSYREPDGSILFSAYTQANMLLVPVSVANEFVNATCLLTEAGVYLECLRDDCGYGAAKDQCQGESDTPVYHVGRYG